MNTEALDFEKPDVVDRCGRGCDIGNLVDDPEKFFGVGLRLGGGQFLAHPDIQIDVVAVDRCYEGIIRSACARTERCDLSVLSAECCCF